MRRTCSSKAARRGLAFLRAGLVDRILLYRAPIIIGGGLPCIGDIGLDALPMPMVAGSFHPARARQRHARHLRGKPMFTGIVTAIGTIRQATRPATFGHDHLPL
jgi:hypothetical protein